MRIVQLICAIIVAGAWELVQTVKKAGGLWTAICTKQQVTDELVEKRLAICRCCPIFYKPLQTCGSPLRKKKLLTGMLEEGCFCHMPTKARLKENCWAYDEQLPDVGWAGNINSWPR